jgi:hypothetical protein
MLTSIESGSSSIAEVPHISYQPNGEVMARGPNFVYAKEFIASSHGDAVWEQVLADMSPEGREVWAEMILVTGSYPFSVFKEMLYSLVQVVGERPEAETAQMYEFIAEKSLSTIYKFFFRFAEPSFVIKRYPILWKRFFESGEVRVPYARAGAARLEFDLPAIFLDWLRPACFGYSNKAVKMAGGRDLEIHEAAQEALPGGIWRTTYNLTWTE